MVIEFSSRYCITIGVITVLLRYWRMRLKTALKRVEDDMQIVGDFNGCELILGSG